MKLTKSFTDYESLIASSMKSFGLRTLDSRVYAFVYCSLNEVSLEEISKHTGYSLASISTVVAHMTDIRILLRIKKPGTKKVFVGVDRDMVKMMETKISYVLEFMVVPRKNNIPNIIKDLKNDLKKEKSDSKKKKIKAYIKFLSNELKQAIILEEIQSHLLNFIRTKRKSVTK